jgi:CBS domain-containing protein
MAGFFRRSIFSKKIAMKKKEPITTIMSSNLHNVHIDDKLIDVNQLMRKFSIRHVPVLKNKQLVGIISKTDINRLAFSEYIEGEENADVMIFDMLSIEQVMTSKPRVVNESATIYEVAKILSEEEFHALPVIDNNDQLVGIVTTTDVIRYLLDQY